MLNGINKSELQKVIDNYNNFIIEYQVIDKEFNYKRIIHFESIKINKSITKLWIDGNLLYIVIPSRYFCKTLAIDDIRNITELQNA